MPSLSTILLAWGILAPLMLYGWNAVQLADAEREKYRAIATMKSEIENAQTRICNGRVATIEAQMNEAAAETARILAEVEAHTETPRDKAAVIELCKKSVSCRDRSRL